METKKRKAGLTRKFISIEKKIRILDQLKKGNRVSIVSKKFNLNEGTVRTIRRNEEKIRAHAAVGSSISAKKISRPKDILMCKMEKLLMAWIEERNTKQLPINKIIVQQKALTIFHDLQKDEPNETSNLVFMASNGWLQQFKKRFSLTCIKNPYINKNEDSPTFQDIEYTSESENENSDVDVEGPKPTLTLDMIEEGLRLVKELQMFFVKRDSNTKRSLKFCRKLKLCVNPYKKMGKALKQSRQIDFLYVSVDSQSIEDTDDSNVEEISSSDET